MTDAAEFRRILQISDETFKTIQLGAALGNAYEFASEVWESPRLYDFTDHGLTHSAMNCQLSQAIFGFLPDELRLTPLERTVLGIASLVHDIGMQYPKYQEPGKGLSDEEVRKAHTTLGFEMLRAALNGRFKSERGGPDLKRDAEGWLFDQAGTVGFAHSGDLFWQELDKDIYRDREEGNVQLYRPRLLAAGLRLADECHCAWTRISNFARLDSPQLNSVSKTHWAACFYVRDIAIQTPGTGGLIVTLAWRVPRKSTSEQRELIRTLLTEFRGRRIREEMSRVKKWLRGREHSQAVVCEFDMAPEPEEVEIDFPPAAVLAEVRGLTRAHAKPAQGTVTVPILQVDQQVGGGGALMDLATSEASKINALVTEAELFLSTTPDAIREHTALCTGWHTSLYVRCRELLARKRFVDGLVGCLTQRYRSLGITDVLAVGTSGIRIGLPLSVILDVRFHFTFSRIEIATSHGRHASHTDYETEVTLEPGARLLLVDDILGVGSVIREVCQQLRREPDGAEIVRAFCLYSLGDTKSALEGLDGLEVDCLVRCPQVGYWRQHHDSELCDECARIKCPTRRED